MPEYVTTRAVAAASGFGQSTVSMALRNDPRIPVATRQLIQETAARLGYQPDSQFSRLMGSVQRRRVRKTIQPLAYALFWPSAESAFQYSTYRDYRNGAESRAAEFGYAFEDFLVHENELTPDRLTKILRTRAIPGILIAPVALPYDSPEFHGLDLKLSCEDFAMSTIGYSVASPVVNRVSHDHTAAAEDAVEILQKRGYQKIGFVSSRSVHARVHGRWLAGFALAQEQIALKSRVPALIMNHIREELTFDRWLRRYRPDAILTVELQETRDHLARHKIQIPEEIGLAHLDVESSSAGINQCNFELGSAAFDILLAQILRNERGIPAFRRTVLLEGRWTDGATVRAPK